MARANSTIRATPIGSDPAGSPAHRPEAAELEHVLDTLTADRLAAPTGREVDEVGEEAPTAAAPLERGEHVVLDGEPAEGLDPLERAAQPEAGRAAWTTSW